MDIFLLLPLSPSSAFFYMTPSRVSAHLAFIPVPVGPLPLFQFISPPHSFQMTLFLLCLPSSPQPIVGLLPVFLPLFFLIFFNCPPNPPLQVSLFLFLSELGSACLSQV